MSEIDKIIDRLKLMSVAKRIGIKPFQTFLLYGASGTGKTAIVKAFGAEMKDRGFNFLSIDCVDWCVYDIGKSEKLIEAAFLEAVNKAPCVMFLDNLEAVCVSREGANADQCRRVVSLLNGYVRLADSGRQIMLLSATAHPEMLDPAWTDKMSYKVLLPLPSEETRAEYFRKKTEGFVLTDGLTAEHMAESTDNATFRELEMIVSYIMNKLLEGLEKNYSSGNNGIDDIGETDRKISRETESGRIGISRELFDEALAACPISNKEHSLRSIEKFEHCLMYGEP